MKLVDYLKQIEREIGCIDMMNYTQRKYNQAKLNRIYDKIFNLIKRMEEKEK